MLKVAFVPVAVTAATLAGAAHALECRAVSGERLTVTSTVFSEGLSDCVTPASGPIAPAGRKPLSPLLQLYEQSGASVDVTLHAPHAARRPEPSRGVVPSKSVDLPAAPVRSAPPPRVVRRVSRPGESIASAPLRQRPHVYDAAVSGVARMYDIDPLFMGALVRQESGFHPGAVSPKGARGLMQVMPGTARRFGVDGRSLNNPVVNLAVGAVYLKSLQRRYGNNLPLVLAAYNAGEGAVNRHGRRVPPYRETRNYVSTILTQYRDGLSAVRAPAR